MKLYVSITGRLQTQHQAIENIISFIESNRLLKRPKPEKWNIHDNIAHLARYQQVFIDRIHQILITDGPSFGRYVADEDPEFDTCRNSTTDALIKKLDEDRIAIYKLVTGLTDTEINRVGMHKKFGRLDITQWTEFFLLHEAHHIFTIFQLAHDVELL